MLDATNMIAICEGFESMPYPDPLSGGMPYTFGHGFTSIEEDESLVVLEMKVNKIKSKLRLTYSWFNKLSFLRQSVIINMAYQLGWTRFQKFKKTIEYLKNGDFDSASVEMLDSVWYRQMHKLDMINGIDGENRAEWLSWMLKHDEYRERKVE